MSKYKICPVCGKHSPPNLWECSQCETDLTSVRTVDENTEKNNTVNAPPHENTVRICDCGNKNPAAARKCSRCGEDISDIIPVNDAQEERLHFTLVSLDGDFAYEITENEIIAGRENTMKEYLSSKPYVSRTHAKFTISDNKLYVKNISSTNFTYVNNEKISGEQKLISDGDEIGLGGCVVNGMRQDNAAYFIVRIGSCI